MICEQRAIHVGIHGFFQRQSIGAINFPIELVQMIHGYTTRVEAYSEVCEKHAQTIDLMKSPIKIRNLQTYFAKGGSKITCPLAKLPKGAESWIVKELYMVVREEASLQEYDRSFKHHTITKDVVFLGSTLCGTYLLHTILSYIGFPDPARNPALLLAISVLISLQIGIFIMLSFT